MSYFEQNSERLNFRKLSEEDIESWQEFFEGNDHLHYLGLDLTKPKEKLARDWVLMQLERYKKVGLGHLAIIEKKSGTFIGMGGIIPREVDGKKLYEIAYSLKPAYWGCGYATELARQLKKYGEENEISDRFVSIIHERNLGSINVARKNGMLPLFKTNYLEMDVVVYGN